MQPRGLVHEKEVIFCYGPFSLKPWINHGFLSYFRMPRLLLSVLSQAACCGQQGARDQGFGAVQDPSGTAHGVGRKGMRVWYCLVVQWHRKGFL